MISFESSGGFNKTSKRLRNLSRLNVMGILHRYGQAGVEALASATPLDTAYTSQKWSYEVVKKGKTYQIFWRNSNVVEGVPVVILLQYGHATGNGGYIVGEDFINPAIKPIFEDIDRGVWKVVTSA